MKSRLVLAGGGHAHLSVLRRLAENPLPNLEVLLISPDAYQWYSGMLPGLIAGHYQMNQCRIDLRPLAEKAKVRWIASELVAIDAEDQRLFLANGEQLAYHYLSLDLGSKTAALGLAEGRFPCLTVKPLAAFVEGWRGFYQKSEQKPCQLVVVGAGAAGVELVLAAKYALNCTGLTHQVYLSGSSLLPGHNASVVQRIKAALKTRGVHFIEGRAVVEAEGIRLSDQCYLQPDLVIAATGAESYPWLADSALQLDSSGFVAVGADHQSLSHPTVFAVGDICARQDQFVARSGVHAVHAGPVLADNLLATLKGEAITSYYQPKSSSLYLLACGDRYAVASWGRFSFEGRWVWHWKDWIDRSFIRRYSSDHD